MKKLVMVVSMLAVLGMVVGCKTNKPVTTAPAKVEAVKAPVVASNVVTNKSVVVPVAPVAPVKK